MSLKKGMGMKKILLMASSVIILASGHYYFGIMQAARMSDASRDEQEYDPEKVDRLLEDYLKIRNEDVDFAWRLQDDVLSKREEWDDARRDELKERSLESAQKDVKLARNIGTKLIPKMLKSIKESPLVGVDRKLILDNARNTLRVYITMFSTVDRAPTELINYAIELIDALDQR